MSVSKVEAQLGTTRIRRGELERDLAKIDAKIKAKRAEIGASVYLGSDPGKAQDDIDRSESIREGIVLALAQADKSLEGLEVDLTKAKQVAALKQVKGLNKKAERGLIMFLQSLCDTHSLGVKAEAMANEIYYFSSVHGLPSSDQRTANRVKILAGGLKNERHIFITNVLKAHPDLIKKLKLPDGIMV